MAIRLLLRNEHFPTPCPSAFFLRRCANTLNTKPWPFCTPPPAVHRHPNTNALIPLVTIEFADATASVAAVRVANARWTASGVGPLRVLGCELRVEHDPTGEVATHIERHMSAYPTTSGFALMDARVAQETDHCSVGDLRCSSKVGLRAASTTPGGSPGVADVRSAAMRCGMWGGASGRDDTVGHSLSRAPHRDVSDLTSIGGNESSILSHASASTCGVHGCALLHGTHETLYATGGAGGARDTKRDASLFVYHGSVERRTRMSTSERHDEWDESAVGDSPHVATVRVDNFSAGLRHATGTLAGARDGGMQVLIDGVDASTGPLRAVESKHSLASAAATRERPSRSPRSALHIFDPSKQRPWVQRAVVGHRTARKLWLGDGGIQQTALVGSATHLTTAEQFDGWEELLPSKIRSTSLTAGAGGGDDC